MIQYADEFGQGGMSPQEIEKHFRPLSDSLIEDLRWYESRYGVSFEEFDKRPTTDLHRHAESLGISREDFSADYHRWRLAWVLTQNAHESFDGYMHYVTRKREEGS